MPVILPTRTPLGPVFINGVHAHLSESKREAQELAGAGSLCVIVSSSGRPFDMAATAHQMSRIAEVICPLHVRHGKCCSALARFSKLGSVSMSWRAAQIVHSLISSEAAQLGPSMVAVPLELLTESDPRILARTLRQAMPSPGKAAGPTHPHAGPDSGPHLLQH